MIGRDEAKPQAVEHAVAVFHSPWCVLKCKGNQPANRMSSGESRPIDEGEAGRVASCPRDESWVSTVSCITGSLLETTLMCPVTTLNLCSRSSLNQASLDSVPRYLTVPCTPGSANYHVSRR